MKPVDSGVDQHVLLKTKPKTDETRAFLTFSSSGEDIESRSSLTSMEHGVCRRGGISLCSRGGWNYVTIFLAVVVALLATTVLVLELYRNREVVTLRSEMDAMRRQMENLNHRIVEVELWDQLKEFEDAVYAEEAATDDDDDDNGDDEDDEDISNDDDDYDLDYDVDEDVTRHEKKEFLHPSDERSKHMVDEPHGAVGRTKREIESSVPVVSESYGVDMKKHNSTSEGLRLYESLVTSGGKNEPKDLSLDWGSTENPIKYHHRVSPLWTSKSQHKKYVGAPAELNEAPAIHRPKKGKRPVSSPIISRVSRVMQTDPNDTHLHQLPPPPPPPPPPRPHPQYKMPDGEVVVRVYQEQRAPDTGVVSGPGDVAKPQQRRRKRPPHKSLALTQAPRLLTAVHYDGDSSKYQLGHEHYEGNGRLRHPDGKFKDWKPANWSQHLGLRNFVLQDGEVTVRDSGIYFIYAQIYYVDEHNVNGFRVYVNDNAILHCTTMTVHLVSEQRRPKSNTCHTSGATYLNERDKVSVRDVNGLRYSLFEPAKSFFGLLKLSDAKLK